MLHEPLSTASSALVTPKAATPATAVATSTVKTSNKTGYVDVLDQIEEANRRHNMRRDAEAATLTNTSRGGNVLEQIEDANNIPVMAMKNTFSWLLCQRWISDGINLQRNGSVNYQEILDIPLNNAPSTGTGTQQQQKTSATNTLRFKSRNILGSFPKQLSSVLVPLLQQNLIRIEAQALMEERSLNVGAHVALSLS
jgi:hypothetical protein